ncbi:MAG: glycosyltransferase [Planctomycetota bacterium]
MSDHSTHVLFAPPVRKDGLLLRGVVATDGPWRIDDELDRDLWAILQFFHSPVVPRFSEGIDLYVTSPNFAQQTPQPQVLFTDRDLVDENEYHPIPVEKRYDVVFNVNWLPFKRHELLIEAMVWAKMRGRPLRCLWFGYHYNELWKGRDAMLRREVHYRGLDVTFADTDFDPSVVNRRYNESHCALNCSDYEGGPRTMSESMLADVPFVVTRDTFGGCPLLIDPSAGIACGNDPQSIAEAIWTTVDQPQLFSPRAWALQNMCRRVALLRLKDALIRLQDSTDRRINIAGLDLYGYDWEGEKRLACKMEQSLSG